MIGDRGESLKARSVFFFAVVLATCLLAMQAPTYAANTPVVLVTDEEYRQAIERFPDVDRALEAGRERATSHPDGPKITIEAPRLDGTPLSAPIAIEVDWTAEEGASVDLHSFRVRYKIGFLSKDLTQMVLDALNDADGGRFDLNGLFVPEADLPSGKHRLVLELADTRKRRTYTELVFEIV